MSGLEQWMLGYLLNSLWQVPMLFVAAWIVARIARQIGPRAEHRVWVIALLLEAVLPACSLRMDGLLRELWALVHAGTGAADGVVRVTVGPGASHSGVLRLPAAVLAGIAIAYGCSLVYFAARLAWGLWQTDAMQRQAQRVSLASEAEQHWTRYRRIFGVERAEIALSPRTGGPVTVGVRRAVMLIPPDFFTNLAEGDFDAVIAHELAHMQRRDFAKNLAYGVVALPVAYHPMLWLTRSQMAATREMVCDAMAAVVVAGRDKYVRSLLRLASLLAEGAPTKTLHAIGIFDANIFERRVMNLTEKHVRMNGASRIVVAVACVVVGLATCASALALRMNVTPNDGGQARMTIPATEYQAVYKKDPVYPVDAKANHDILNGPVVLAVTVSKDGMPTEVHVTRSLRPDYDESALMAVREWRWHPYLSNGSPVAVDTTVTVNYSLQ